MGVSAEIVHSLRVLELPPDADASEVRSAFRRLARTYHPDVAGRQYSRKYEQIAKAYALLKELPREEFSHSRVETARNFSHPDRAPRPEKGKKQDAGRRFSFRAFRGVLGKPFVWYRSRKERIEAEKERQSRAVESARKKILLEREVRVNAVISRGERLIDALLDRQEREARNIGAQGLALRLMSELCQIRHLALSHSSELINEPEIFDALSGSLKKWDIDGETARLVSMLPLKPENLRRLALCLAGRAAAMPDSLLSHLLKLYGSTPDRELLESYLGHAGASGVALILRRWPRGSFVSEPTLRRLISHKDESVLVTILSAMKQRSVPCPEGCLERLNSYMSHPNTAVRVWARALLPMQKT